MCEWYHMISADRIGVKQKLQGTAFWFAERYNLVLFSHKQMTRFANVNYPHSRNVHIDESHHVIHVLYNRQENGITTFDCKLTTPIMGSLFSSKTKKLETEFFGRLYSPLFNVVVTHKSDKTCSRDTRSHAGVISGYTVYGLFNFKRVGLNAAHSMHHVVVVLWLQKFWDRPIHRTRSPNKCL